MLQIIMFFLSPFYKWKTRRDTIRKMNLRTRDEILDKMKEFEQKMLANDRISNKPEAEKYHNYMTIMKWMIHASLALLICCSAYAQEEVKIVPRAEEIEYIDDKTASNTEYYGWAMIGSDYTDAYWKILRITYSGNTYVVQWADSNSDYDNVIYNYQLLTYD